MLAQRLDPDRVVACQVELIELYASLLIPSVASVKVVQSRLGRASATTTLDTYGHLFPDEEDRTRAAVDAEFQNLVDSSRTRDASTTSTRYRVTPGAQMS